MLLGACKLSSWVPGQNPLLYSHKFISEWECEAMVLCQGYIYPRPSKSEFPDVLTLDSEPLIKRNNWEYLLV